MDIELIEKALEEKWLNLRDYSKEEAEVFKKAMDKTEVILNTRLSNNYYDLLEKELLENISNYFEVLQEEHCTSDCSVDGCASHCTSEYEVFSKAYHILSKRVKAKA